MNDLESQLSTVQELVAFGRERGVDLGKICHEVAFSNEGRFIILWRKEGKVHYNMQGRIEVLPHSFQASAGLFRGMWREAGNLPDLQEAFEFLKAWLIDRKEVDDLPPRYVRREGIG